VKANGVTFAVHTIRVTQVIGATPPDEAILGDVLIRRGLSATLTPVISTGKEHKDYFPCGCVRATLKEVDTFQHWEFALSFGGWRRWLPIPDRELRRILNHHCALELWTRNVDDSGYSWIHWLFPSTSWLPDGRGRWKGRSYPGGPNIKVEDYPDFGPLSEGGFWKTATPPPERSTA
jgi:hypothetical protein